MCPRARDHAVFARHVREEFADLLPRDGGGTLSPPLPRGRRGAAHLPLRAPSTRSVRRLAERLSGARPRLAPLVIPDGIELASLAPPARRQPVTLEQLVRQPFGQPGVSPAAERVGEGEQPRASAAEESAIGESGGEVESEESGAEGAGDGAEKSEERRGTYVCGSAVQSGEHALEAAIDGITRSWICYALAMTFNILTIDIIHPLHRGSEIS